MLVTIRTVTLTGSPCNDGDVVCDDDKHVTKFHLAITVLILPTLAVGMAIV